MAFEPTFLRHFRRVLFTPGLRAEAWELISHLMATNVDAAQALELGARTMDARKQSNAAAVLRDIRQAMRIGDTGAALRFYGNGGEAPLFANLETASLPVLLAGAARITRTQVTIRQAIVSALAMPSILIFAALGLYYMLGSQLFPAMREVSNEALWNPVTATIAAISEFVVTRSTGLFGTLFIIAVIVFLSLSMWSGSGRGFADRLPPWSLYKFRFGVGFAMSLVELARSGGDINSKSIRRMGQGSPRYVRSRIERIARHADTRDVGAATMAAGDQFPSQELNAVLETLAPRENGMLAFGDYLDRWVTGVERQLKRNLVFLNITLLTFLAFTLGGALLAMITSIDAVG